MPLISGITITLFEPTQTGVDDFGAPVYTEQPVSVDNVLVTPVGAADLVNELQLSGKRAEYELGIPKGDAHAWANRRVEFYGAAWRTIGYPQKLIARNTPLCWGSKIRVERYG